MFDLSQEKWDEIRHELSERGALGPCHRCSVAVSLQRRYISLLSADIYGGFHQGNPMPIPCAMVLCDGCKAITLHFLIELGISPGPTPYR